MGLDITAYEKVKLIHKLKGTDEDYDVGDFVVPALPNGEGFENRCHLAPGVYDSVGKTIGFRAGSYSGYNDWRDWLSRTFTERPAEQHWYTPDRFVRDMPFHKLINFSDCEGIISGPAAVTLLADFKEHAAKAKKDASHGAYSDLYATWHGAFKLAAAHGCVRFH